MTFTDLSSGGITAWSWDFGDGGGSTAASPTHVYGAAGHLAEAMPDKSVAWEVTWVGDKHNGRTTIWEDLYQLMPDNGAF